MGFDIRLTFPKTPPTPKDQILRRVEEMKKRLGPYPEWLCTRNGRVGVGCLYKEGTPDVPPEFTTTYGFVTEDRVSSKVGLHPFFVLPKKGTNISPFQIFFKIKMRATLKQIWEYLMLDLWSHILRYYSQTLPITLKAPIPVSIGKNNNALYMSYNLGGIGDRLHRDFSPNLGVELAYGKLTLYQAFALHLGALAHIKEAEEIKHGDYQLRHLLFDPGNLLDPFFYYVRFINEGGGRKLTSFSEFLTTPSLSVVDLEHSLRVPKSQVQLENEVLLKQARGYAASQGLGSKQFEMFYREGYDLVQPQGLVQKVVDWQYERLGFSVDRLF